VIHPTVSLVHAELRTCAGGLELIDLSSRNGTFVNGKKLIPTQSQIVHGDDLLQFGAAVFRLQLQGLFKISLPTGKRLSGQSGDQIKVKVCKSGITQLLKSFRDIIRAVGPAQLFQVASIESLRAKAGAIDTEPAQLGKVLLSRSRTVAAIAGVYFESYFSAFDYLKTRRYCRQNALYLRRCQQRRSPAAEINRINRRRRFDLAPTLDL